MPIPEFILRKLFVRESLKTHADGFSFALLNTFAPGTITSLALHVDGKPVPADALVVQIQAGEPRDARSITAEHPFPLPMGVAVSVEVRGVPLGQGRLALRAETREAGTLAFTIQATTADAQPSRRETHEPGLRQGRRWRRLLRPQGFLRRPPRAEVEVDAEAVLGEIHPHIYGQFVEHLERCVYGGIWTDDGSQLRPDTLALIRALRPPVIRYPGGNFASGYHWEDGIGPKDKRPRRYDAAWQSWESNQVGTDEFMAFCAEVGADPFLVVNDGSGTPEQAARWVAYCNDPPATEAGQRRAANGHAEPYRVRLWGVGNEVWGAWQIGHTGAAEYVERLRRFAAAMRAADPDIRIVAVGDGPLSNAPGNDSGDGGIAHSAGYQWNDAVLRGAGDLIDYLSFHIYQPEQQAWQETYDLDVLHHTICAAPLDVEAIVQRMAAQIAAHIAAVAPARAIRVALDEWNVWLSPPEGAATMHRVVYTLRDALYAAGMFNVFHRQCNALTMANLAQLVNVLPLIVTDERRAVATALYYPFLLYRDMERLAVNVRTDGPTFNSEGLGRNISPHQNVPYLDVSATRDETGRRLVLGIVNRHPTLDMDATFVLRGWKVLRPVQARVLGGSDPLAANTLDEPDQVSVRPAPLPKIRGDRLTSRLPASSVTVLTLETGDE